MADDRIEFTFNTAREIAGELLKSASSLREQGNIAAAEVKEAQATALTAARGAGVPTAPEAAKVNEELARANALRELGKQLDVDSLEAVRQQTAALAEQQAIRERLSVPAFSPRPGIITASVPPRYGTGVTAGQQVAAEEAALQARAREQALQAREQALQQLGSGIDPRLLASLQASQLVTPSPRRAVTSYDQTAGAQVAATRAAEAERQAAAEAQQRAAAEAKIVAELERQEALASHLAAVQRAGYAAGIRGRQIPDSELAPMGKQGPPPGLAEGWTGANASLARYNATLGTYRGFNDRAGLSTAELNANVTRLGMAEAEASDQLRRHGALTTEFLTALARGETTVSEFGYQIGATIGKFGGWAIAAAATYAAFGAVTEFGRGAVDAASGVQRLTRTIENLDATKANQALQGLSQETNVPLKEAADAVFQYSRTFHTLPEAVAAARNGLSVFKLDNVALQDSMRLSTAFLQQFGQSASDQQPIWNMLAAGQRLYNARLSETVPLLRTASGAVRTAGGDLDQLVQLSVLASRSYPGYSGQIGTAISRAVAVDIPKNLPQLQSRFGLGQGAEASKPFEVLLDAIRASATMQPEQRRQLASLVFDPRYGARFAGLFGPQAASTFSQITGTGPRAITPAATQGALQEELSRELGTARERMHSFINEIQRQGAAFGASGIIDNLTFVLSGIVKVGGAFRGVIEVFDQLPASVRTLLEATLAVRAAQLFVSRTRFGSTIPGVNQLPGFRPSEATVARRDLAVGTRQSMNQLENNIAQSNAASSTNVARQVELERERAAQEKEIADVGVATEAQMANSVAINAKIVALQTEQLEIERTRNFQQQALAGFNQQYVGLTATSRRLRTPDDQVLKLRDEVNGTVAAEATGTEENAIAADTSARARLAAAKRRMTVLLGRDAAVSGETAAAAGAEGTAAALAGTAANDTAAVTAASTGMMARWGARIGGLAAAIDPWLLGIVALPLGFEAIQRAMSDNANAADGARKSIETAYGGTMDQQFEARSRALAAAATASRHSTGATVASNIPLLPELDAVTGLNLFGDPGTHSDNLRQSNQNLRRHYDDYAKQFRDDAKTMLQTQQGRHQLYVESQNLERAANAGAQTAFGGDPKAVGQAITAFNAQLQQIYEAAASAQAARAKGPNEYAALESLTPKQLTNTVRGYTDRANTFGLNQGDMSRAGQTYLFLAARYRDSKDNASLQLVQQAQQAFVSAVNRNVSDFLKASQSSTTFGGQEANISGALGVISQMRSGLNHWVAQMKRHFKGYPDIIRAVQAAATQLDAQFNDQLKTAVQDQLSLIKAQSDLQTSQITGSSPEADIARSRSALGGLHRGLTAARQAGADYRTIAGLQAQLNDAATALAKQQDDNARRIVEAQGRLATSDIARNDAVGRAQQDVANAARLLSFDQAHGAGQGQLIEDRAALNDARSAAAQTASDEARSIIDAQGRLQVAAITGLSPADDIARARASLASAQRILAFDQGNGAKESQILQDQAAVDDATRGLNEQIQQRDAQLHQDLAAFIDAQAKLAESQTLDPVKQAREQVAADVRILSTIKPQDFKTHQEYQTAVLTQRAKINDDRQKANDALIQQDLSTLRFEHDTNRIGDQQYIRGLEQILHSKKLSLAERQQILSEIYNIQKQTTGDLNLGSIRIPTAFEIRRAVLGAQNGINVTNHYSTQIQVADERGATAVGTVFGRYHRGVGKSIERASGLRR